MHSRRPLCFAEAFQEQARISAVQDDAAAYSGDEPGDCATYQVDTPTTPVAPEPGIPVDPGHTPTPPIAPEPSIPVDPGHTPTPPIAPEPGIPVDPGHTPTPPIAPEPGIPVYPGNIPGFCRVRVLNGAAGFSPLRVAVGAQVLVNSLSFSNISGFTVIADGFATVTVATAAAPRTVLIRQSFSFRAGDTVTLAVYSTQNGVAIMQISDNVCRTMPANLSCLRCVNLSFNSPPLNFVLYDGRVVFDDVRFKEVTSLRSLRTGSYLFYVAPDDPSCENAIEPATGAPAKPDPLLSFALDAQSGYLYTVYFIGVIGSTDTPPRTLIAYNRVP